MERAGARDEKIGNKREREKQGGKDSPLLPPHHTVGVAT